MWCNSRISHNCNLNPSDENLCNEKFMHIHIWPCFCCISSWKSIRSVRKRDQGRKLYRIYRKMNEQAFCSCLWQPHHEEIAIADENLISARLRILGRCTCASREFLSPLQELRNNPPSLSTLSRHHHKKISNYTSEPRREFSWNFTPQGEFEQKERWTAKNSRFKRVQGSFLFTLHCLRSL